MQVSLRNGHPERADAMRHADCGKYREAADTGSAPLQKDGFSGVLEGRAPRLHLPSGRVRAGMTRPRWHRREAIIPAHSRQPTAAGAVSGGSDRGTFTSTGQRLVVQRGFLFHCAVMATAAPKAA